MRIWHVDVRSRARVCCGDACEPASLVSKMIRGTKFFFSVRMLRDIFLMRKSQKTFGGALKDKMHPIVTIAVFV